MTDTARTVGWTDFGQPADERLDARAQTFRDSAMGFVPTFVPTPQMNDEMFTP